MADNSKKQDGCNNSSVPLTGRRGVLKGIGIGAVGLSTVGTASADDKLRSAEEAGVLDDYNDLISQGEIEKAHELLDRNRVRYTRETRGLEGQNPEVTPDIYTLSESEATCSLVEKSGDTWLATGIAELDGLAFTGQDYKLVNDVLSLSWASSDWSAPTPSRSGVFLDAPSEYWSINYDSFNPDHGPSAELEFTGGAVTPEPPILFQIQTDLEWIGDNPNIPVKFTYRHNAAYAPPAWVEAISVGGGSLSVDLSPGASMIWDNPLEALADPSE
jgi:hypothetical protein